MSSFRLILRQVELGPMMNFVYLIGCPETREAAVIDPAWDVPSILDLAGKSDLRITRILLTHGHPDHMNGLESLLEATDAKVSLHALETEYMKEVAAFFSMPVGFMGDRASNFQAVSDGDTIAVGKLQVEVLHTPGHTPGSQCFLVDGNLVSGDTLFVNACGRVDMPGGDPEAMWHSLTRRLAALDDQTLLYPGHNYGTRPTATMGEQKQNNPYLRFTSLAAFVRDMSEP
jgi:hydroxyacylglutathione hydrolase